MVSFLSDVFHPLVTPLTTYTYAARDAGAETVSAADRDHLPAGGLNLRHGFPEWFDGSRDGTGNIGMSSPTITVEMLRYLRVIFDMEAVLDSVTLEDAANNGAWHAWRSYRSKTMAAGVTPAGGIPQNPATTNRERSTSPREQPGGARRPGEWNWQGVWQDRVTKSIQASVSDNMLYGGDSGDAISFSKMDAQSLSNLIAASHTVVT